MNGWRHAHELHQCHCRLLSALLTEGLGTDQLSQSIPHTGEAPLVVRGSDVYVHPLQRLLC
jgi:hypothetical protein